MPYASKEAQRCYQRAWLRRRRAAYLAGRSCVYCGSTEQLELNHVDPSTKVTHRVWSRCAAFREAELAATEVACRSCHLELGLRTGVFVTRSILSPDDVRLIRRLRHQCSPQELGRRFGVTAATCRDVLSGRTWTWVSDDQALAA